MITKLSILCVLWSNIISVLKTKYIASNIPLNFSDAQNHCKSLGSNLASLHSSQDMIQAQTKCSETGTLHCWIGLIGDPIAPGSDSKKWKWTDGTSTDFGFVNNNPENPTYGKDPWDNYGIGDNEPNNGKLKNITENCVELWKTELKWNDWQCKEEYYFLCNPIPNPSPSMKPSMGPTEALPTSSPTVSTTTMSAIPTVSPSMKPSLTPTYAPTVSTTFPYIASHDARNFSEAEKYCESLGSNLASLHSSLDMTQAKTICHQTGTLNCWIGLQGTPINPGNDTKHWQWTDNTVTDFGFVNNNPENPTYGKDPWDDDKGNYEPNNGALNNITENCVELWKTGLKWNDWQCKQEYYFLCNPIPTSPSMKPSMAPTEAALPTSSPTVSPTKMSAILEMRCDNIGNVNISYDGLVFEEIGYIDTWTKELRLQLLNITRNTVIIFTCRDTELWGGFIANINYEGIDYSTTNNVSENLYTVISASDNVTSPLYFRGKWYEIWRQHMNGSLLPNKSYWIWNTNQSNKNNTMVFQFNFTAIIDDTRRTEKINMNIIFIIIAIVSGFILLLCLVFICIRCRKRNKVDDLRFSLLENGDDSNKESIKWDVNNGFTKGGPDNPKSNEEEIIRDQEVNDTKYRMKMNMHGGVHTDTAGVVDFTAHSVNVADENIQDERNLDDDLL